MTATINCAGCHHAYSESALFCPNCGRPKVREALADPLLGKLLGERFVVQELLGQGGSGTIYRAEHITLRRKVAIKVLHTELSRDDLAVERFRREATTVAEIDNEHIVEIHDFGRTPDGRLYLAMELLEGETLDAVLEREQQLSIERAADILIQVGEALMEAHAIGYVHRDLRPRNIYLAVRRGKANFIKLLDFGLAKLVETEGQAASTSLGMTFGDPRYMSPEQARGDRIDRRADIYQLGCVAYEMLTGAPPFGGNRVFDILTKQVTEVPLPLPTQRRGVPLWMEAAVTKMLAKDPENRFATTTRMVEALRRGLDTGEVMEDEVARRRESIPPPSVSRVMQRMGLPPTAEPSREPLHAREPLPAQPSLTAAAQAAAAAQPLPAKAPMGAVPAPSKPAPRPTGQGVAAKPPSGASSSDAALPASTSGALPASASGGALPASASPAASASGGAPAASASGAALPASALPASALDAMLLARAAAPASASEDVMPSKPDSVELLRKRTGTPRIGVPIVSTAPADEAQPAVAGVIDPVDEVLLPSPRARSAPIAVARETGKTEAPVVRPPISPEAAKPRGKRPSDSDLAISQVWYDEGDQLSADHEPAASRVQRARKTISPSTTDLSFYDDHHVPPRRWGAIIGLGLAVVLGGTVVFALTRGPSSPVATPSAQPVAAVTIDAAPSTIIANEPPPSEVIAAAPEAAAPSVAKPVTSAAKPAPSVAKLPATAHPPAVARPPAAPRRAPEAFTAPGAEPSRRPAGTGLPKLAPVEPTPVPVAPSLTDTPKDPYGGDDAPSDVVAPEKKAEFFSNLGSQQLIGGDTTGAASNFKKALELDNKNVVATTGMGEIALRQGLFGDAIAHLSKAAKLAPRNAKPLTLLGEAYLSSGNNAQAAAQFKKALLLDPDNARARDGYNEASSRVPPPDDETP